MRRSGSSSCLLRPKSEVEGDKMSVTLINTQPLPTYSTERFYMLSELELNSHSTTLLCDTTRYGDCDETQDTVESSEASTDGIVQQQYSTEKQQHSLYNILYVLWRPDQVSNSPRAFAEGPVATAIQQWKAVVNNEERITHDASTQHLYLVVDIAASPNTTTNNTDNAVVADDDDDDAQQSKQRRFQVKVDTAERLARYVAQSQDFRSTVDGITVGVSNHVRAAPGLEACLDAVLIGSRDRRRYSNNSNTTKKSSIGLVVLHPDDFLGLQNEAVTDAVQGVLQSRVCAEWNGNGNLQTFARRAHSAWCVAHHVDEETTTSQNRKPRAIRRRRRDLDGDFAIDFMDPLLTFMVIFFFGFVLSHLWITYYAEATNV